ncbi:MAG: aminomethyl transferase family protein [Desulfobacterales bacterium]|nr:aminomethyl transferase family protein [Desulfobacterales bacterium]
MQKRIKRTPLYDWHTNHGATMADFGGYEMPLWYASAKNEHLSVLKQAGLFDTSHMAALLLSGPGAHELLQLCFTNNLDACVGISQKPLSPGRCVYGAFLNAYGEVIDDCIVARLSGDAYMVVVNAGMGAKVAAHLNANKAGREVDIDDLTDRLGKIDVQGPLAAKIVSRVLAAPETVLARMPYFAFKGHFIAGAPQADAVRLQSGVPVLLSRTGYTGEFGFEIFVAPEQLVTTWEMICAAGNAFGLETCGLAARDSLRGGAVLPLSHQDIGDWPFINHPWLFALPFNADRSGFTKTFIGDKALLNAEAPGYTYAFVGADLRKVSTADPAVAVDGAGNDIGRVLTCVSDMGIGWHEGRILSVASPDKPEAFVPRGLSCGFVKVATPLKTGTTLALKDSRRKIKVTIVEDIRPARTARRPIKEML